MQRYFYDGDLRIGDVQLCCTESHHLCTVTRAKVGDTVAILNGNGQVAMGMVKQCDKKSSIISIKNVTSYDVLLPHIALLQSTLANSNNDFIVREATAIGATEIVFFEAEKSECRLSGKECQKIDRWNVIAIEACKQSGNPFSTKISYCKRLSEISLGNYHLRLFGGLTEHSKNFWELLNGCHDVGSVCIAIGPEGDFSPTEYEYLRNHGFVECRLTKNVLRSESAALYSLAVLDNILRR